jgi:hypothetical protein
MTAIIAKSVERPLLDKDAETGAIRVMGETAEAPQVLRK